MKLDELILKSGIDTAAVYGGNAEITGVSYDSRQTKKGDLFFALPGSAADGDNFIPEAVKKGASAVASQRSHQAGVPSIKVTDIKTVMARMAEAFYGFPSTKIDLYGITGTNGKTTVTYMLESIVKASGESCAVFGTVNYRFGKRIFTLPNTTAESADISRLLAEFVKSGGRRCFIEMSSQGLDRKCAEALTFKAGVFTNLSREHLDWHGSMENYAAAKRRLFEKVFESCGDKGLAVINSDDPWSEKILNVLPLKKVTYGINKHADYSGKIISMDIAGTIVEVKNSQEKIRIELKLPGEHNAMNALAAFALAREEGFSVEIIKKGLEKLLDIKGRLSRITSEKGFTVYVDYAHTPDALEKVIRSLKPLTQKRIITVFGAGGNRDRGKRPLMGKIVFENSDFSWITSDNPRNEDPRAIALDIEVGMRKTEGAKFTDGNPPWRVELDRKKALSGAIAMAEKGDIILIAGKGHEEYQIVGEKKIPYSDIATVKKILKTQK
ncbi:UDP-N-acetylmuramoyl-L-alanyl-D-glutamate--2,6-diaminopimelate ligase [bacterium]|nr:UDP-N-acetylmuramoyl-L-alanyl-D-glutamate--2,6-diaminopimelate ligase [Candidatus Omnitrophota bacterium]MBU2528719.1 UDP-N-acetylmuramoyl-L-alanyl-D-glutamate--2,6-diaminopimelate ligase [bacterium]MBU3929390.1 UDP-N-acetylmuramoyl-L-alanyl-D-glutamate--2,6-diaminopimelate ligase [bacterium]MBU4123766.1 UDP-N-acetylmuramoyl-L-alanyl-D-glutamate--2,6-diaminopimelate ligase [bacterium]